MSKKYLIILGVQFIVMAMCLIFAIYQQTLAQVAREDAMWHSQLAQKNEGLANELQQDVAMKLAECERALRECKGEGK